MAVRIQVKDFQSIEDASVEVKGFTVITGTNNAGKSALVRAIRGVFQNSKGTSFVRYGKPSTTVQITFDDGHEVKWEKGKDIKPTYTVDDGKPIFPGQGIPDEVRALKVAPLQAGGREYWPQLAPQFDGQVFLLDQPGSVLAEAVADVTRVGQLNEALRGVESDRRAAASELKVRQADALRYGQRLEEFAGLDEVTQQVEKIEKDRERISLVARAIEGLTVLFSKMQKAEQTIKHLEGIELVDTIPDGDFTDSRNLLKEQEELTDLLRRKQQAERSINDFEGLDLSQFQLNTEQAERFNSALTVAEGLLKRRQAAELQIRNVELELNDTEKQLGVVTDEIKGLLGDYSECPLCGSSLEQHEHGDIPCVEKGLQHV